MRISQRVCCDKHPEISAIPRKDTRPRGDSTGIFAWRRWIAICLGLHAEGDMEMLTETLWGRLTVTKSIERRYLATIRRRVREAACAIHGHDLMLHYERGRVCLRCVDCGHETNGWSLN
jgi:hypothetical protein